MLGSLGVVLLLSYLLMIMLLSVCGSAGVEKHWRVVLVRILLSLVVSVMRLTSGETLGEIRTL